uniref:Solute carrier family 22 member 13 (inferred by orthology to a human protein) n=1 Tax=Strongyloides venezuelensis TaxID=75913 RepID=A0A0K0EY76_STRVS
MTNDNISLENYNNDPCPGDDNELFDETTLPSTTKSLLKDSDTSVTLDYMKSNSKRSDTICEEILEILGSFNPYSLFIMLTMATLWGLAAMNLMISAFLVDPIYAQNSSKSIFSTFNLTDNNSHLANLFSSSFMFGSVFGGAIVPVLADYFGRKINVAWCTFIIGAAGCVISFVDKYYLILVLRFIQGFALHGTISTNWVLSYESVSVQIRSFSALVFGILWVVGYCIIAPLAYYFTDWRYLCFFTALPSLIFSFIIFLSVPESLNFLINRKKMKEIKNWLKNNKKFSKLFGKVKFPNTDNLLRNISTCEDEPTIQNQETLSSGERMVKFFKTQKLLLLYIFIFTFIWATDTVIYYVLSFFSTNLSGNMYINYVLSGLIECPSYLVVPLFLDYLGRRGLTFLMHFITSIALFLGVIIGQDKHIIYLLIWLVGKFCISCTFTSIFVYGSEIFPTSHRNTCLGICAVISRLGGVIAPYSKNLDTIWPKLSIVLFASMSLIAALLSLVLPETGKIKSLIRKKKENF